MLLTAKFHHHMFNRSEVIMRTNKHTDKQTDAAENIHLASLRYATPVGKKVLVGNLHRIPACTVAKSNTTSTALRLSGCKLYGREICPVYQRRLLNTRRHIDCGIDEPVACILRVTAATCHRRVLALVTAHGRRCCRLPYATDNCRLRRTQFSPRSS